MTPNQESSVSLISQNDIEILSPLKKEKKSITDQVKKFYINHAEKLKTKADAFAAEVLQRQDKMRHVNDLIAEINNLTDEKNQLDLTGNEATLEKLQIARDLGVKLKEGQTSFNGLERDRLIENLHLSTDSWDKENRHHTQKIEILVKELDRLMLILKDVHKKEDQAKRPMLEGIRK